MKIKYFLIKKYIICHRTPKMLNKIIINLIMVGVAHSDLAIISFLGSMKKILTKKIVLKLNIILVPSPSIVIMVWFQNHV